MASHEQFSHSPEPLSLFPIPRRTDRSLYDEIELSVDERLRGVKRFQDMEFGHQTLKDAFDDGLDADIVGMLGESASGKTWGADIFANHYPEFRSRKTKVSYRIISTSYENDGEKRAIRLGRVLVGHAREYWESNGINTTGIEILLDSKKPWTPRALYLASYSHGEVIAENMIEEGLQCFEGPGITAVRDSNGVLQGRDMDYTTIENLVGEKEQFENLPSKRLKLIVLEGAPLLRLERAWARYALQKAKNLDEAQKRAEIFGTPVPLTQEDFKKQKGEGATFDQIIHNNSILFGIAQVYNNRGLISPSSEDEVLDFYKEWILEDSEYLALPPSMIQRWYWRAHLIAHFAKYLLEQWGMDSSDCFIGLNRPTPHELGIKSSWPVRNYIMSARRHINNQQY